MDRAEELARRWIDTWTRGWRDHDAETVAAAYAEGAFFLSYPFRERERPRDYARGAFAAEDAVELWFAEPRAGVGGAAVEYWAIIRSEGRDLTLAGVTLLRFGPDGRVADHRDYWAMEDGVRRPPSHWGPAATHAARR